MITQHTSLSLNYLLTPWSRVLLEKLTGLQLVQEIPPIYGTRRFITAFTSACHLSLTIASSIQPTPSHPTSWKSALILPSHLRLGLPSGIFPLGFPPKTLNTPLPSPIRATCSIHLILLHPLYSIHKFTFSKTRSSPTRITQKRVLCVRLTPSIINILTVAINYFHGEFMSPDGNNETYQI
jgi:hypothetical protein